MNKQSTQAEFEKAQETIAQQKKTIAQLEAIAKAQKRKIEELQKKIEELGKNDALNCDYLDCEYRAGGCEEYSDYCPKPR